MLAPTVGMGSKQRLDILPSQLSAAARRLLTAERDRVECPELKARALARAEAAVEDQRSSTALDLQCARDEHRQR